MYLPPEAVVSDPTVTAPDTVAFSASNELRGVDAKLLINRATPIIPKVRINIRGAFGAR
jgi:hypothetical protein